MSIAGDGSKRVAPDDAPVRDRLKGLAFKAGTVDREQCSPAWSAPAPLAPPPADSPKPAPPRLAAPQILLVQRPATPQPQPRWITSVLLSMACVFAAAVAWVYNDRLWGRFEMTASASPVPALVGVRSDGRATALQRALVQERAVRQDLERQLNVLLAAQEARRTIPPPVVVMPPVVETAAQTVVPRESEAGVVRLMARARLLLEQGDVGAARSALERAAEAGYPLATFTLAESYDPGVLSAWGTVGTLGDTAKARLLYARAAAGGVTAATDRLKALTNQGEDRR